MQCLSIQNIIIINNNVIINKLIMANIIISLVLLSKTTATNQHHHDVVPAQLLYVGISHGPTTTLPVKLNFYVLFAAKETPTSSPLKLANMQSEFRFFVRDATHRSATHHHCVLACLFILHLFLPPQLLFCYGIESYKLLACFLLFN